MKKIEKIIIYAVLMTLTVIMTFLIVGACLELIFGSSYFWEIDSFIWDLFLIIALCLSITFCTIEYIIFETS